MLYKIHAMKKHILIFVMMALAIGNLKAYDFITYAPHGQTLFCNILDQENHLIGLTFGSPQPTGDLVIPETVHVGGVDWTITEIMDDAFNGCTITSVTLPNTVTAIGNRAFYMCTQLSGTMVIPNSVNSVGFTAFCRCDRMTEVVLPERDVTYGTSCFMTTGLTGTLTLPEGLTVISDEMFSNNSKLTHVVFPSTLTTIGANAFAYCDRIEEITIPSSVTTIYDNPFHSSEKIGSVIVEEGNPVYYSEDNCIIHQATHTLVVGSKNGVIPEGVVAVGPYAFSQCGLTHMPQIPASVTTIGTRAFAGCNDQGALVIPETVTDIAQEAFVLCRFSTINIPQSIDTLVYRVFGMCQWMGEVTLPESVNCIGESAFSWCTSLRKIYAYNPVPPTVNTTEIYHSFDRVPRSATVYVPQGSLSAYQNAPGWNEFANIVEMNMFPLGTEWYYEIQNENGSITYQHLQYTSDTVIHDDHTHIIIRINTLYDKDFHTEQSFEYIYANDNKVFWWNKTLEEFTMLYDFNAEVGDEWVIKVGEEQLLMHVDAEGTMVYNDETFRTLTVSDPEGLFSGTIICGLGHETSFFPERLMSKEADYRVEGIRCVWQYGQLIFQQDETACDEVYVNFYYDVDESTVAGLQVYPNPTNGRITLTGATAGEYRISTMLGQTIMTGRMTSDGQQIDVSELAKGMYFITIGNRSGKFVVH